VYIDFWGWTSDPAHEGPYLVGFLSSVGGSPWLAQLEQYCAGDDPVVAGQWTDRRSRPSRQPSNVDIRREGAKAARHFGVRRDQGRTVVNDQIIVALPPESSLPGADADDCGYHERLGPFPDRGTGPSPVLTVLPYLAGPGYAAPCGAGSVNPGADGALDGVSITVGHELVESITDPDGNAWFTGHHPKSEVADRCENETDYDITLRGHVFAVPELWSNVDDRCVVTGTSPGAPEDFRATGVDGHIDVTWSAPAPSDSTPVISWSVTTQPRSTGCTVSMVESCTFGAKAGVVYRVTARATNAAGTGPPTAAVEASPSDSVDCLFFGPFADLRGCDLSGTTLTGADLTGADLTAAQLPGSDLLDADLSDADLAGADLRGATLTDADLTDADLTDADLTEATLRSSELDDATLTGAELGKTELAGVSSVGIASAPASLPVGWDIVQGYLVGPEADLVEADLSYADLSGTDLSGADLANANLKDADISDADLEGADLAHADLTEAVPGRDGAPGL